MNASDVIKTEFTRRIAVIQRLMATAPDFRHCLIALLAARATIDTMLETITEAIDATTERGIS